MATVVILKLLLVEDQTTCYSHIESPVDRLRKEINTDSDIVLETRSDGLITRLFHLLMLLQGHVHLVDQYLLTQHQLQLHWVCQEVIVMVDLASLDINCSVIMEMTLIATLPKLQGITVETLHLWLTWLTKFAQVKHTDLNCVRQIIMVTQSTHRR